MGTSGLIIGLLAVVIAIPSPHAALIKATKEVKVLAPPTPTNDTTSLIRVTFLIEAKGTVSIQEELEVKFAAGESRHGIIRLLPKSFLAEDKEQPLEYFEVAASRAEAVTPTKWGHTEEVPVSIESNNDATLLRLGSKDTPVSSTRHRYSLTYKVRGGVRTAGSSTSFTWFPVSLWSSTVPVVTLAVSLPSRVQPQEIDYEMSMRDPYAKDGTGPQKISEDSLTVSRSVAPVLIDNVMVQLPTISLSLRKPLPPRNILALSLKWPAEYVPHQGSLRAARLL